MSDKLKNCKKHGFVPFKQKISKKGEWWVCNICLKDQWKKASAKRRKKPEVIEYQRQKSAELVESRRLLAGLLILLSFILPPD